MDRCRAAADLAVRRRRNRGWPDRPISAHCRRARRAEQQRPPAVDPQLEAATETACPGGRARPARRPPPRQVAVLVEHARRCRRASACAASGRPATWSPRYDSCPRLGAASCPAQAAGVRRSRSCAFSCGRDQRSFRNERGPIALAISRSYRRDVVRGHALGGEPLLERGADARARSRLCDRLRPPPPPPRCCRPGSR